jgi:hypothetical protein
VLAENSGVKPKEVISKLYAAHSEGNKNVGFDIEGESGDVKVRHHITFCRVADPDLPDPHVFGPPGSGSTSQRYGSGSGSCYNHAKIVRKTLIPIIL